VGQTQVNGVSKGWGLAQIRWCRKIVARHRKNGVVKWWG